MSHIPSSLDRAYLVERRDQIVAGDDHVALVRGQGLQEHDPCRCPRRGRRVSLRFLIRRGQYSCPRCLVTGMGGGDQCKAGVHLLRHIH